MTAARNWDRLVAAREPSSPLLDDITAWRTYVLTRAGYTPEDALLLAEADNVDLHVAVWLAEQGCPLETRMRILL